MQKKARPFSSLWAGSNLLRRTWPAVVLAQKWNPEP
jgi:hypothetical protein